MALELAWKATNYGPDSPYVVVKHIEPCAAHVRGTYGVYKATSPQGHTRPIGSGSGCVLADAITRAEQLNECKRTGIADDEQRSF